MAMTNEEAAYWATRQTREVRAEYEERIAALEAENERLQTHLTYDPDVVFEAQNRTITDLNLENAEYKRRLEFLVEDNIRLERENKTLHAKIAEYDTHVRATTAEVEHLRSVCDDLRQRIDTIFGTDEHFAGWSETDLERYSQLSPPEMFNLLRQAEAENADLRRQLAQTWVPVEDGAYGYGDEIKVTGDDIIVVNSWEKSWESAELPPDLRLCRRQEPPGA